MATTHRDSIHPADSTPAMKRRSGGWRAVGAALAIGVISIGSISAWQVNATSENESSFVPTAPCRLFDTRPGTDPSGGKKTPLGPGESNVHTQQVTGTIGNCQVPTDAVAVSMNVTAVNGTAQSNLRVYPADVPTPTASNLNWVARQSPTPNKVDVQLSPAGAIKLYNHNGTIDVLADVVGYYTPTAVADLRVRVTELHSRANAQEQTVDELAAQLAAAESRADAADQRLSDLERATPFAVSASASGSEYVIIGSDPVTVLELDVAAPVDGSVTVDFSSVTVMVREHAATWCAAFKRTEIPTDALWLQQPGVAAATQPPTSPHDFVATLAATKRFTMRAGESTTFALVCEHARDDGAQALAREMTAIFTPS